MVIIQFTDLLLAIRFNSSGPQIILDKGQRTRVPPDEAQMFTFWVVTNIPGNNVELGNEMFSYVPPLALQFEAGKIDKDYPAHNSPLLVFEQKEKVCLTLSHLEVSIDHDRV